MDVIPFNETEYLVHVYNLENAPDEHMHGKVFLNKVKGKPVLHLQMFDTAYAERVFTYHKPEFVADTLILHGLKANEDTKLLSSKRSIERYVHKRYNSGMAWGTSMEFVRVRD